MSPRQVNFSEPASLRRSTPRANNTRHEQVNASYLTEATSLDFTALPLSRSSTFRLYIYVYIYYNRESGRSELVESALHLAKKKKKERKKEKRNKGKRRRRRRKREGKKGVCDGPLSSASALCRPGGEGREGKKRKKGKKTSRQSPLTRWRFSFSTTIHDARSSQRYLSRLLRYTIIYIYILYFSFFSISFYSIDAIAGGAKETSRENERESENRGDLWQPGPEKLIGVGALRAPVGT